MSGLLPLPAPPPAIVRAAEAAAVTAQQAHLLLAIAWVETRWNPLKVGKQGERGLTQLHPKYHIKPKSDLQAFKISAKYIAKLELYAQCQSSTAALLTCWNFGPTGAAKLPLDKRAHSGYSKRVLKALKAIEEQQDGPTIHDDRSMSSDKS